MPKTLNKLIPSNIELHEYPIETEDFRALVLKGLTKQQKELSPHFFYDQQGSDLFEQITRLDEYYLTRIETEIMTDNAKVIQQITRNHPIVIEPGSGNNEKIANLFQILKGIKYFVPIEISRDHLWENSLSLATNYPYIRIVAVASDYMNSIISLSELIPDFRNPLVFFPGSSIGNYQPVHVVRVLKQFVHLMGGQGRLLIGVDLKKDPLILEKAYNDEEGITAAFNLNALYHIKRELDIEELDPSGFVHRSFYNQELGRVEMHLESLKRQQFEIDGRTIQFQPGETIHTENSYKYTIPEFQSLASQAGLNLIRYFTDPNQLFSVQLYEKH